MYGKEGINEFYIDICNSVIKIAEFTKIQYFKELIAQFLYSISSKKSISVGIKFEEEIMPRIPEEYQKLMEEVEFNKGLKQDQKNID